MYWLSDVIDVDMDELEDKFEAFDEKELVP